MERFASSTARLDARDRETLRLLCDVLVPAVESADDPFGFFRRGATDLAVDEDLARIVEEYLAPSQRRAFRRLLRIMDSPAGNLFLAGRPRGIHRMSRADRERYLLGWARSRLGARRRGFQALKRLVLFLFYAKTFDSGANPNWPAIGYDPPPEVERPRYRHPEEFRVEVLRPEREATLEADACVVGSGAGGAVIAAALATAGHRVVVLEAGPYRTPDEFTRREAETYDAMFEAHGLLTTRNLAFVVLAGRTAGGSTTVNWMTCLRPPPWAREEWEREGLAGVASPTFDALLDEVWARLHVSTEESTVNPSNDVLRRGCEALGYRWGIDYDGIPRNALGCQDRCDACVFGCIYSAKQSTLVTYLPDAYRAGARFLFDTAAERILVEGGTARGVDAVYRGAGREIPIHVRAGAVVAAGGAIQTPALLLRSGIRFSGVGRGLRLDPTTALLSEFPHPVRMWKGPMQTILVRRFQDADEGHHGPWFEGVPGHPGLSAMATPWAGGQAHKDAMRRLDRAAASIVLVRDLGEGTVTVDVRGAPVLDYRLTRGDRRNLTLGLREVARIHWAAGARRISTLHARECSVGDGASPISQADFEDFLERIGRLGIRDNDVALFSAHPMGSARAGRDPKRSAADPTGECHEVRNLWIGDGSLLPTPPGVNPMISIMALAARTARFVHERLRKGG